VSRRPVDAPVAIFRSLATTERKKAGIPGLIAHRMRSACGPIKPYNQATHAALFRHTYPGRSPSGERAAKRKTASGVCDFYEHTSSGLRPLVPPAIAGKHSSFRFRSLRCGRESIPKRCAISTWMQCRVSVSLVLCRTPLMSATVTTPFTKLKRGCPARPGFGLRR
jgi:hypothetical protein